MISAEDEEQLFNDPALVIRRRKVGKKLFICVKTESLFLTFETAVDKKQSHQKAPEHSTSHFQATMVTPSHRDVRF